MHAYIDKKRPPHITMDHCSRKPTIGSLTDDYLVIVTIKTEVLC